MNFQKKTLMWEFSESCFLFLAKCEQSKTFYILKYWDNETAYMHWFLFFFPHANDMFHVHLPCLNILTEILHTSLLSQFNVTSHHNNYGPTRFVFSLNVNFEIYIMYKLSTHNCCLCQINCCCRIFKRPLWLLVYCHVYAPQYVQERFSCWEINTS